MGNLVAIVGRPNVGKSTLFNRLTQSRRAIVSDTAGTTRDRQYGKCSWNGREFSVVDTGGWVVNSDDIFEDAIRQQVLVATEEADLVLFVVDNETGVTDWDEDVALILRRTKLPVILVANKVDNSGRAYEAAEFYKLGLGDPQCISAATGGGTGDLLDLLVSKRKISLVLLLLVVLMQESQVSSMPLSVRSAISLPRLLEPLATLSIPAMTSSVSTSILSTLQVSVVRTR